MPKTAAFYFVGDAKSVERAAAKANAAVAGTAKTTAAAAKTTEASNAATRASTAKTAKATEVSHAQMRASAEKTGRALRKMALGAGAVGVLGIGYAVKAAASFEKQMSSLGAVSNATGKQMDAFRKQAMKAGADTMYSAKQAAEAQTELAKGGLSATEILGGGLKAALGLAAAGELQLADAASYTANAMNLFGIKGKDATHVADALATAANATTADVSDFGMALAQGGSVAKSAGLSFNETVLALEALAKSGIKNADAGTSLKTSIIQLLKPSAKQAELAKSLGLSFLDASGHMKSLGDISGMLRDKLGGQTKAQRTATLATLAGTDGVRTLTSLYDAGPEKLKKWGDGLLKSGTAADVARKKQKNLAGQFEQLKGSTETLAISVGSKLLPWLTKAAKATTQFVNQMQTGKGAGGDFAKVIGAIVNPIRDVVKGFKDGETWAVALVAGLAGLTTAAVVIKTITTATKLWTAAQVALDLALNANPISIAIVAITAISAAFYVAYKKSATFRKGVDELFTTLKRGIGYALTPIVFQLDLIAGGVSTMLHLLGHVPGFGWANDAADAIDKARQKTRDFVKALRDVPAKKHITITTSLPPSLDKLLNMTDNGKLGVSKVGPPGLHRAGGGSVPGSGRGDTVPAMLEPGEFVVRRQVVEKFGPTFFANLNGAKGYAEGGVVSGFNRAIGTTRAGPKPSLSLFEAGIVESGLANLDHGDADSQGALQLRTGLWGEKLARDPYASAVAFLTRGFTGKGGAISLAAGNPGMSAGQIAQAVQGSAFPGRYDAARGQAIGYVGKGAAGASGASGSPARAAIQGQIDANQTKLDGLHNQLANAPTGKAGAGQRKGIQAQIRAITSANRGLRGDMRNAPTAADITARQEHAGSRLFNRVAAPFSHAISAASRAAAGLGADITDADTTYGQLQRRQDQSTENLGTPGGRAQRLSEIAALTVEKGKQLKREQARAKALQVAITKTAALLKAEGKARDKAHGAKRAKIVARMKTVEQRLTDLKAELHALGFAITDTQLDLGDLAGEHDTVKATPDDPSTDPTTTDKVSAALAHVDALERAGDVTPADAQTTRIGILNTAIAGGFGATTPDELLSLRGDLRDATSALTQATVDNTSALRDLKGSIDAQLAFAGSVSAVTSMQAVRAMSDVISGQLGYNAGVRGTMPGSGQLASLGSRL